MKGKSGEKGNGGKFDIQLGRWNTIENIIGATKSDETFQGVGAGEMQFSWKILFNRSTF